MSVIPVPQLVDGLPVVGAIAVPARPRELPATFLVICQRPDPDSASPYLTMRASTCDGITWSAAHPVDCPDWPAAVASFASRASLPPAAPRH
jgi:hypothetical protein